MKLRQRGNSKFGNVGKQEMQQLNLSILTAELSITNNTLLTPLIAVFSQQLITLAAIVITHKKQIQSKYCNNDSPLQSMSQIRKSSDKKHEKLTTFKIEKIIKSLKSEDARGYDEIFASLLKISSPFISSPLNYTCNEVLTIGSLPIRLKLYDKSHIHKRK